MEFDQTNHETTYRTKAVAVDHPGATRETALTDQRLLTTNLNSINPVKI